MDELNYTNEGYTRDMRINAPSNKGLLAAMIFFFSPLLFVIYFIAASLMKVSMVENPVLLLVSTVTVFGMVLLWAAGIVKCVSEIGRYYSATAEVGLFIFLITPFIWGVVGLITMASQFAGLASRLTPYLH